MNELLLAGWALGVIELEAEHIEQLAELVCADNGEGDIEAPYFIRIINVAEFGNQNEVRDLAYIALRRDFDEQVRKFYRE